VDLALLDPDVVFEDNVLPDHARETYRGHEGVIRAARGWLEAYGEFALELEQIVGTGGRSVSIHRFRGKGRHSGIEGGGTLRVSLELSKREGHSLRRVSRPSQSARSRRAAGVGR
jgi:hypothetical protein